LVKQVVSTLPLILMLLTFGSFYLVINMIWR